MALDTDVRGEHDENQNVYRSSLWSDLRDVRSEMPFSLVRCDGVLASTPLEGGCYALGVLVRREDDVLRSLRAAGLKALGVVMDHVR